MKNTLALLFILLISFDSYAFLGLFEKKRPDPFTLKTEEEQMNYLKEYMPDSYERVLRYKRHLAELNELNEEIKSDDEWNEYSKYSSEVINIDEEKAKEFRKKVEERKKMEQKVKEMEEEILSKYKVVNGKLINKNDEKEKERKEQEEKLLRERIIEFQKKNNLPVLQKGQDIKVKKE